MNLFALLSLLVLPFYIILGWYVYNLDSKSRLNKIFIFLTLCFSIWAFSFIFFYSATDKATAWFWYNLSSIGRLFYPALILNLVLIFTKNRFNSNDWYKPLLLYIPPIIFLYTVFTGPFITQDLILVNSQWYEVLFTNNIWRYAYNAYYLIYVFLSFIIIGMWGYKTQLLREKKQSQIIIFTGLVAFALGTLTNTIFPYYNLFIVPAMAQIFGIIFFSGIAYAIIKYKFLKLNTAVAAEEITSKITDLVFLIDNQGKIVNTNIRARRLLGYSQNEIEGQHWQLLVQNSNDQAYINNYLEKEVTDDYNNYKNKEINLKTKKGNILPINSFLSVIKDNYGIIGVLLIGQDLRPTRKLQDEIREKNEAQKVAKAHEEKLKKSLMEKELLLKEIHHRVKNNMQVISSLINLQSGYLKDKTAQEALKESQVRIMSMAMIHDNLYRSDEVTGIEFKEYIDHLTKNLLYTYNVKMGKIEIDIQAKDIFIDFDTAIPCGLIINELVTNSIKHAFPDDKKGVITIRLVQDQDQYYLTISDNGVGIPPEMDVKHSETLGLLLVNSLVGQLEGSLEVTRNRGTTFHITFQELEYLNRI
jgi:PAS domain S-box-containing protein